MSRERNNKLTKVMALSTTAGTAVNTASVDMEGYDEVWFFGNMVTSNASNSAVLASSSDDASFVDITGSSVIPSAGNQSFLLTAQASGNLRYIRCEVDRGGANTVLGEIYAIQFRGRKGPATHGATIEADYVV